MDRQIVFPGSIPLDTDLLGVQRSVMVALGALMQATLGTGTVADGFACTQTVPASLQVSVGPGSLTQFAAIDTLPFGSLPAAGQALVKAGINRDAVLLDLVVPNAPGQQISHLVQVGFLEQDAVPVVLPYYNAANPAQPYSGPTNSGAAQNTRRLQRVQVGIKAGPAGLPGAPGLPSPDPGFVGLYIVTVAAGSPGSAVEISVLPGAPFLWFKLPQLAPGFSRQEVFSASATWAAPAGVRRVKVRLAGAGGGGGGSSGSGAGGGGGAGGYAEGSLDVVPGQAYYLSIGAGGSGGAGGQSGGSGQDSWFSGLLGATGGAGGLGSPDGQGGVRGVGQFGGSGVGVLVQYGGAGGNGVQGGPGGTGGASFFGGGGRGAAGGGEAANGDAYGSGGGGASGDGTGGLGANGGIVIEY